MSAAGAAVAQLQTSVVGRWWLSVDRWTLAALATLACVGGVLILAASPPVAERIGVDSFHFARKQLAVMPFALGVVFAISLLTPKGVRRLAVIGFCIGIALVVATLVFGVEVKGARRWLTVLGLSIQPSEFVKPCFAVVAAWMFSERWKTPGFPGFAVATGLCAGVVLLLLAQPDVGMAAVITAVWGAQFFVAGLPLVWMAILMALGVGAACVAYLAFPHVAHRVDMFLDPQKGDSYQVERAMEAFQAGGLFGRGPGEGIVKNVLPDAHTDFIFAVAGEEFGLVVCLAIVGLFAFIVLRGMIRLVGERDYFVMLASGGLLVQFGLQAVVNIGVNLRLLPTKGMTLPFISYGGSSLLALALGMGMVLALTRREAPERGRP
jgi:cell division protein FtsW